MWCVRQRGSTYLLVPTARYQEAYKAPDNTDGDPRLYSSVGSATVRDYWSMGACPRLRVSMDSLDGARCLQRRTWRVWFRRFALLAISRVEEKCRF